MIFNPYVQVFHFSIYFRVAMGYGLLYAHIYPYGLPSGSQTHGVLKFANLVI